MKTHKESMKKIDELIVDAAMRWTKHVSSETPQGDFVKAQENLVLVCKLRRAVERVS